MILSLIGIFIFIVFFIWLFNEEKFRSTQLQIEIMRKRQKETNQEVENVVIAIIITGFLAIVGLIVWEMMF